MFSNEGHNMFSLRNKKCYLQTILIKPALAGALHKIRLYGDKIITETLRGMGNPHFSLPSFMGNNFCDLLLLASLDKETL